MDTLLNVENLKVIYEVDRGDVKAINDVSFSIKRGEIFGLVGESGCGKSTTAFAISRLLRQPAKIVGGTITFDGIDLTAMSDREFDKIRWSKISIVLQSAMNNLNPVIKIQDQLIDVIITHKKVSVKEAIKRAEYLLELVDIPIDRLTSYPHQLSGGMRQRIVIAMALALDPGLIIMDEPTTALDVVVQKGILKKIIELQGEFNFSILFITHDLPMLLEICDRIGVMYAGKLVEIAEQKALLKQAKHPYTKGLLDSFPSLKGEMKRLKGIAGHTPDLISPPQGCNFHPRCPYAMDICKKKEPIDLQDNNSLVSCHLYSKEESHVEPF